MNSNYVTGRGTITIASSAIPIKYKTQTSLQMCDPHHLNILFSRNPQDRTVSSMGKLLSKVLEDEPKYSQSSQQVSSVANSSPNYSHDISAISKECFLDPSPRDHIQILRMRGWSHDSDFMNHSPSLPNTIKRKGDELAISRTG